MGRHGPGWRNEVIVNHEDHVCQVIYAGDSAADEIAMEALRGVAYTFKVINEDTSAITKTWANARLQGPDSVLMMLKFLERKLSGRKIRSFRPSLHLLEPQMEIPEFFIADVRKHILTNSFNNFPSSRILNLSTYDQGQLHCLEVENTEEFQPSTW